ncbi:PREDICTED: uncharacterized protein LOC109233850 [Nicotiana attenuata]|uniref:Uncharacterized protein n=1 Tax=Nicotiana attenuata TaxID=49451 RepID=A0A1J6HXV6_NICAT|nr:PREDICTED: uncharacterized protein LOC109233850 [Nicotiana attenuata]OIS97669.1 hypothetical protein A4A49_16099 [Nicotiana attenuata]
MGTFKKIGEGALQFMGHAISKIGQSFQGRDEKIDDEIVEICYDKYFRWTSADFYHAICQTVEEINRRQGSTQIKIPSTTTLLQVYEKYHKGKGTKLTKDEFRKIVRELIHEAGVTGYGAKDTLFYLFGIPVTALFIKQRIKPQAISDEIFIPAVTSATVLVLAKFNKV